MTEVKLPTLQYQGILKATWQPGVLFGWGHGYQFYLTTFLEHTHI